MKIYGKSMRTIWVAADSWGVEIIDQTRLPFAVETRTLRSWQEAASAIRDMVVRGAPLIGATGAYGLALAMRQDSSDENLERAYAALLATRPTAVNLRWALDDLGGRLTQVAPSARMGLAYRRAAEICDEDVETCKAIGKHGLSLIRDLWEKKGKPSRLNVLTHCNAGWLACIDWGTALAPIYMAFEAGIPVHVWVDETRPRNQGASLTAFELGQHGVDHTVIADNLGGHLMQHGLVDLAIVGTDRTTATGDVCNKIGTYLKALAAHDNGVPFYVALPFTTIDWTLEDGVKEIPIEERDARELSHITGRTADGRLETVDILPKGSPALNYGFDVTPARLVTGLITERGVANASRQGLLKLYPEQKAK
ncbi:Methylthioribose-1-phosphate isomerase [uncultured Pleomorphomonas sp.]|uniref:Methylthioribose-1-phosphate isomerase n=1 Tax=uncultured Pleomorphomonas sp. TaxID=442121 RepID=A0A212LIZ5_9HYPH|nr:S-methyl-5-thioribose-1-phosphate isomerase [uncultured Pleomorphomonas sp.]SCM77513.1 Methylthioribose-1-phosphate isomerase [uncultured Pleomorphomonas sp.]